SDRFPRCQNGFLRKPPVLSHGRFSFPPCNECRPFGKTGWLEGRCAYSPPHISGVVPRRRPPSRCHPLDEGRLSLVHGFADSSCPSHCPCRWRRRSRSSLPPLDLIPPRSTSINHGEGSFGCVVLIDS